MAIRTNAPKLTPALPDVAPAPTIWWEARTRQQLADALLDANARLRTAMTILSEVGRIQRCACDPTPDAHGFAQHDEKCFVSKVWRFLGWL